MTSTTAPDRPIDELISGGRTIAMLMTMIGSEHTSRPVTCLEVAQGRMAFLVSKEFEWVEAIASGDAVVHVTVADDSDNTYLSLTGSAKVSTDKADLERLWTPVAKAWFEGPEDPKLAAIFFSVVSGEYWDGPNSKIGQAIALVRGVLSGNDEATGDQGQVTGSRSS